MGSAWSWWFGEEVEDASTINITCQVENIQNGKHKIAINRYSYVHELIATLEKDYVKRQLSNFTVKKKFCQLSIEVWMLKIKYMYTFNKLC